MRFFVDTNILISSMLFPKGKTAFVFSHVLDTHTVIISDFIMDECKKVFSRKFPDKIETCKAFFESIKYEYYELAKEINSQIKAGNIEKYPKIRDKSDYPILVSAILSDADILLTGDKDFEDVKLDKPLIFSPTHYFKLISKDA